MSVTPPLQEAHMLDARFSPATFSAVVRSPDGIHFTASAPTRAERSAMLLEYVVQRCEYTLWPVPARQVRALIEANDVEGAIATYFDNVGERWDEERLELRERRIAMPWLHNPPFAVIT